MKEISCPHCAKPDTWNKENPYRPFCSKKCRLIDLGSWANEEYCIPDTERKEIPKKEEPE